MKVHVHSVPTQFSQPMLVSSPCPGLLNGHKWINEPFVRQAGSGLEDRRIRTAACSFLFVGVASLGQAEGQAEFLVWHECKE